jgi:hypothetical protein
MRPIVIAGIAGLCATFGCQLAGLPVQEPHEHLVFDSEPVEAMEKEIKPLMTIYGMHSKITKQRVARITLAEDWRALWSEHVGPAKRLAGGDDVEHIEPDFDRVMAIAVFMGKGAYVPFTLDSIVETSERIMLRKRNIGQRSGAFTPDLDANSQPWGVIILPRSNKEIVLQYDVRSEMDAPPKWKDSEKLPALAPPVHLTPEHLHGGIGP